MSWRRNELVMIFVNLYTVQHCSWTLSVSTFHFLQPLIYLYLSVLYYSSLYSPFPFIPSLLRLSPYQNHVITWPSHSHLVYCIAFNPVSVLLIPCFSSHASHESHLTSHFGCYHCLSSIYKQRVDVAVIQNYLLSVMYL
jgi:hypothetical protein